MKKILVVDDDAHCRLGLRDALMRDGYNVHCAADSHEAIGCMKQEIFGVAIIDLDLPPACDIALSGLDLVAVVQTFYPACTVIVVAADETHDPTLARKDLGVHRCLIKHINLGNLRALIGALPETRIVATHSN